MTDLLIVGLLVGAGVLCFLVILDANRHRYCPECGRKLNPGPRLYRLDPVGDVATRICADCFGSVLGVRLGAVWPGPYTTHDTPDAAAHAWRAWQAAGRPPIPGLWPRGRS